MSSFQHKMTNYEVIPPADAWEKIEAALDEAPGFATRLYNSEVPPPAAAWASISAALALPQAAVVPMRKRTFLRYAIAAAFIGIAAFGMVRWIAGGTESTPTDLTAAGPAGSNGLNRAPDGTPGDETGDDQNRTAFIAGQAAGTQLKGFRSASQPAYTYRTRTAQPVNAVYAYEDHLPDMSARYITLMTPDGNFIRMSKKWEDLVCCVSGEEQDDNCKTQIKKWQEKLASSPQAASPGNFLDILSLVSSLDDKADL